MSKRSEQQNHILYSSLMIVVLAAAISVWGMLAIYRTLALTNSWEHFLGRQSLWMLAAWVIFFLLKTSISSLGINWICQNSIMQSCR